jgi:DNA-binding CsgD family transcriptional regulator
MANSPSPANAGDSSDNHDKSLDQINDSFDRAEYTRLLELVGVSESDPVRASSPAVDRDARGRYKGRSLSPTEVKVCRDAAARGRSHEQIARKLGCSRSLVTKKLAGFR